MTAKMVATRYLEIANLALANISNSNLKSELLQGCLDLPYWSQETKLQELYAYNKYFKIRQKLNTIYLESREKILSRNLKRLSSLVDYAFCSIPFYQEFYKKAGYTLGSIKTFKDFQSLPLLTKDKLRQLYQSQIDEGITFPYRSTTSGSTGQPVMLLNDERRTCYWYALRLNMFESMLASPLKKRQWIYNYYYEPFYLSLLKDRFYTFSQGINVDLEKIYAHIKVLRPRILTGVASRVLELIEAYPDLKNFGVETVSTNSETSSQDKRKKIEEKSNIAILDEYSSEELGIIAWQTLNSRNYVVAEDAVHLELLNIHHFGENLKQVVGTCFNSFIMPRIRYIQGDFAEWEDESANASDDYNSSIRGPRYLKTVHGRDDMTIIRQDGQFIHPSLTLSLIDSTILKASCDIKKFRLLQKSKSHFVFLTEGNQSQLAELAIKEFIFEFKKSLGNSDVHIVHEWSDLIPRLKNKHRSIIREF